MKKKTKILLVTLIGCISFLIVGWIIVYTYVSGSGPDFPTAPDITFTMNESNMTLTVENIQIYTNDKTQEPIWENIAIRGNATLPFGPIDVGDMVTNCSGTVTLIWLPYYSIINEWEFT